MQKGGVTCPRSPTPGLSACSPLVLTSHNAADQNSTALPDLQPGLGKKEFISIGKVMLQYQNTHTPQNHSILIQPVILIVSNHSSSLGWAAFMTQNLWSYGTSISTGTSGFASVKGKKPWRVSPSNSIPLPGTSTHYFYSA